VIYISLSDLSLDKVEALLYIIRRFYRRDDMAITEKSGRIRKKDQGGALPFTKQNYILFVAGILTLIVGYIALSIGPWDSFWSLTLAPVLLVLAYCVIIPVAILYRKKKSAQ
jgi:hypothetical protein